MLSYDEIKHNSSAANDEQAKNLQTLLERVNKVRTAWAQPMTVTSGLRTKEDQIRIYKDKAAKKQFPFLDGVYDESKVPMNSRHMHGAAVDVADPDLKITAWLKANPKILEDATLWCEDGNSNWVHFQCQPFGSYKPGGTRWFKP